MLGILKIWKNNGTFRRPCHNRHGCAWHQMKKVSLLPEMAAIIKPLRQIFISAAHMEKGRINECNNYRRQNKKNTV